MNAKQLIERDPEKLGGTPVFFGTRVPVKDLFDYLETGETLETFLDDFPTVTREQVSSVLEVCERKLFEAEDMLEDTDLLTRGISQEEAAALRARLSTFAEDWERPEMDAYDDYDHQKAALDAQHANVSSMVVG